MATFSAVILLGILAPTQAGYLRCQPLSTDDMKFKLFSFGGMLDKTYVALTLKDAKNFTDLCVSKSTKESLEAKNSAEGNENTATQSSIAEASEQVEAISKRGADPEVIKIKTEYGTETRIMRNCYGKGTQGTGAEFIRLCTECSITTILPDDFFPRYLNEITCSPPNQGRNCFGGEGRCSEVQLSATFLRKKPRCVQKKGLNGRWELYQEWEPFTRNIVNNCKCELKRGSRLEDWAKSK